MSYTIRFCQGENSEHVIVLGDGKSGKTQFVRETILGRVPSSYKIWCYDYNHNGFDGIGTLVRSIAGLLDANVQYLPQEKTRVEMDAFMEKALTLGYRIVAIDEFGTQQNSKSMPKMTERFIKTFRHKGGSWIVISQSPLEMHDMVYHNADHIFAFFMDTANRHIEWYYKWFRKPMIATLIRAHNISKDKKIARPYIYRPKGGTPQLFTPGQQTPKLTKEEIDEILGD